jgi:hypothetical protein
LERRSARVPGTRREVVGQRVTLRQTLVRQGPDAFDLLNEELRPDGTWLALDRYSYRRTR